MLKYLLCGIWSFAASLAKCQDLPAYEFASFSNHDGLLEYRILYPETFDTTRAYPVVIFLHGAYERGADNISQLRIGGEYFLRAENRKNFPAIIIFPQCPATQIWVDFETQLDSATGLATRWHFPFRKKPATPALLLKGLLDSLVTRPFVDAKRVYIGGLSQGGMGVFDMIARYPDLFAAAFPICGAGLTSTAKNFAGKVAVWIFHGEKDEIVPPRFSRDYFRRLQKLNSDVKYTEYPGVHHNSWVNTFKEPELLSWLFSKSKKG